MFVALSAGFASCSDDDNKDASIIGTWELVKEQVTETKPDGSVEKGQEETPEGSTVLVFNADKTGSITSEDDGDKYTATTTWSLDGNKLVVIDEDKDAWEYEVLSFNDNQLVLRDVFEDGDWTYTTVTTFTKK